MIKGQICFYHIMLSSMQLPTITKTNDLILVIE